MARGLDGRGGRPQPAPLPGGLVDVPADDIRERLDEPRRGHREAGERGARPDRRRLQRVPTLVEQLEEVAEPARLVRREHPRRPSPPSSSAVGIHPAVDRERRRDGRPVGSREDVVADPERGRIGPERCETRIVERPEALDRDVLVETAGGRAAQVPVVPRLDPVRPHDGSPGLEDRPEHRLERAFGQAERDRARLDRRAVAAPPPCARGDQGPIRAASAPVAVDRSPDRPKGLEVASPVGRVLEPREAVQDGEPVEDLRADTDRSRRSAVAAEGRGAQASDCRVVVDPHRGIRARSPFGPWLHLVEPRQPVAHRQDRPVLEPARRSLERPVDERIELAPEDVEPSGESAGRPARGVEGSPPCPGDDEIAEHAQRLGPGRLEGLERADAGRPTHPASLPARRSRPAAAGSRVLGGRRPRATPGRAARSPARTGPCPGRSCRRGGSPRRGRSARSSSAPVGWTSRSGDGARS